VVVQPVVWRTVVPLSVAGAACRPAGWSADAAPYRDEPERRNIMPSLNGLFAALTTWLLNLITVAGGFFLLIDLARHVFSTPRDLRAAGIDIAVFVILLAIASQSNAIVTWASNQIR
jgi:hypothetical protein